MALRKKKNLAKQPQKRAMLFIFLGGEWEGVQSMAVMLFWHRKCFSKLKSSIGVSWKTVCGF